MRTALITAPFTLWLGRKITAAQANLIAWLELLRRHPSPGTRVYIHDPAGAFLPLRAGYAAYLSSPRGPMAGAQTLVVDRRVADARAAARGIPGAAYCSMRTADTARALSADIILMFRCAACGAMRRGEDMFTRALGAVLPCVSGAPGNLIICHGDASRHRRSFARMFRRANSAPGIFFTYDTVRPEPFPSPDTIGMPPPAPPRRRRRVEYPEELRLHQSPGAAMSAYLAWLDSKYGGMRTATEEILGDLALMTVEDSEAWQADIRARRRAWYRRHYPPQPLEVPRTAIPAWVPEVRSPAPAHPSPVYPCYRLFPSSKRKRPRAHTPQSATHSVPRKRHAQTMVRAFRAPPQYPAASPQYRRPPARGGGADNSAGWSQKRDFPSRQAPIIETPGEGGRGRQ